MSESSRIESLLQVGSQLAPGMGLVQQITAASIDSPADASGPLQAVQPCAYLHSLVCNVLVCSLSTHFRQVRRVQHRQRVSYWRCRRQPLTWRYKGQAQLMTWSVQDSAVL